MYVNRDMQTYHYEKANEEDPRMGEKFRHSDYINLLIIENF